MKVKRIIETEVTKFEVGDQIKVGKYTATAMKQDGDNMIFCFDQYLDKPYTHENLLEKLNDDLLNPDSLIPISLLSQLEHVDGYLFRVPYAGEMFNETEELQYILGHYKADKDGEFLEVWPAMKDGKNRIAIRKGDPYEWGWLMNETIMSAACFAFVGTDGVANCDIASDSLGVRPVFQIANK